MAGGIGRSEPDSAAAVLNDCGQRTLADWPAVKSGSNTCNDSIAGSALNRSQRKWSSVDGVHDLKQPKRLPCYAWLNKWLDQESEGADEPPLKREMVADLNCTPTGFAVRDLASEDRPDAERETCRGTTTAAGNAHEFRGDRRRSGEAAGGGGPTHWAETLRHQKRSTIDFVWPVGIPYFHG